MNKLLVHQLTNDTLQPKKKNPKRFKRKLKK